MPAYKKMHQLLSSRVDDAVEILSKMDSTTKDRDVALTLSLLQWGKNYARELYTFADD